MAEVHDRILNNLRVLVPAAESAGIELQVFNTVDDLTRNILLTTPPASASAAITTWLSEELYKEHSQTIIHGTAWRLYAEPGKPWTSEGLAKLHYDLYETLSGRARIDAATASSSPIVERILDNLRVKLPGARLGAIKLELFNVIDELARESLYINPPSSSAPIEDWLTTAQYETHFRLLIEGVLARMYAQVGQPYSSLELAKAHMALYEQALGVARVDHATTDTVIAITGTLMDTLRTRLPGAKDGALILELGNVIDELCRAGPIFQELIEVDLIIGETSYEIAPTDKDILNVFQLNHATMDLSGSLYDDGFIHLVTTPVASETTTPMYVLVSLVPKIAGTEWTEWLPERLWTGLYQALIDGVLFRMMTQLGMRYTNTAMATYHGKRFRSAIASARRKAAEAGAAGAQNWRFPRFAR